MGLNGGVKGKRLARGEIIAALDVGTTKVVCLIARALGDGGFKVIGIGHRASRGLRAGVVADMTAAEEAIAHAVQMAEQMAGETIRQVVVSLTGGPPVSRTINVEIPVGGTIGDSEVRRVMAQARQLTLANGYNLLHVLPVGYAIDGNSGIRDPRGMYGERLAVRVHAVAVQSSALRNLGTCVARCQLDATSYVAAAYASGLACLATDEMDLGCVLIDIGGGTTTLSVFYDGSLVHTDMLPLGGVHITNDIARGLTTSVAFAERLKTLHGSTIATAADERDLLDVPQIGEESVSQVSHQVPKSVLVGIIKPRIEEIFEMARDRLEASGAGRFAGRRAVLTGGTSLLPGIAETAQSILAKQVRLAQPHDIVWPTNAIDGPALATAAGLLMHATHDDAQALLSAADGADGKRPIGRVVQWFRDNL